MSSDPFAKWAVDSEPQQAQIPQEDPFSKWAAQPSKDVFDEISTQKPRGLPGAEFLENVTTHPARTGMRMLETAIGIPRALGEFGEKLVPEKAIKYGAQKLGIEKPVERAMEFTKEHAPYKLFPTTEQARDFTKHLFGERYEPKNKAEQISDEIAGDFAALAFPMPGSQAKLLKPLLLSIGGNLAGEAAENVVGGDKAKTYTKLGTFLLGSMINPKAATNLRDKLYTEARKARPEDATVATKYLRESLGKLSKDITEGGIPDSAKPALEKIADIEKSMQGELIPVSALEKAKTNINEELAGIYNKLAGNKPGIKRAKRNLEQVSKHVNGALDLYGTQNPEWAPLYKSANEVHGAIAQSQKAIKTISKIGKKYGPAIATIFGFGHISGIPHISGTALGTAALGYSGIKAGEFISKIMKSPTLRKYYLNSVKSAIKEDLPALTENLNKLEAGIEE